MGRFLLTWILGVFVYGVSGSLKIDKDSPVYKAYAEADKDLTHLEKHNFETLTAAGRWTIFFGIEGCGHCQRYLKHSSRCLETFE